MSGFAQLGVDGWVNLEVPKSRRGELRSAAGASRRDPGPVGRAGDRRAAGGVRRAARRVEPPLRPPTCLAHGPVSRWRWSTPAQAGPASPQARTPAWRVPQRPGLLDRRWPWRTSTSTTQVARKMPIFTRDVLTPSSPTWGPTRRRRARDHARATPAESTSDRIADLLGVEPDEARSQLGRTGVRRPDDGRAVTAAEYLSGDVRTKLAAARERAGRRRAVDPSRRGARGGAATGPGRRTRSRLGPEWRGSHRLTSRRSSPRCSASPRRRSTVPVWSPPAPGRSTSTRGPSAAAVCTAQFGTESRSAVDLLDDDDEPAAGRRLRGPTRRSHGPCWPMRPRWRRNARSCWSAGSASGCSRTRPAPGGSSPSTTGASTPMCARVHDGSHLGAARPVHGVHPPPHQLSAVARIVAEPSVLLDHAVGAGKTGTMVMAGMEMRRLGLVRQPWYVVPNHMLEQFAAEFKQWYPRRVAARRK